MEILESYCGCGIHIEQGQLCEDMLHVACNVSSVHLINRSFRGVLNFIQKLGDLDK